MCGPTLIEQHGAVAGERVFRNWAVYLRSGLAPLSSLVGTPGLTGNLETQGSAHAFSTHEMKLSHYLIHLQSTAPKYRRRMVVSTSIMMAFDQWRDFHQLPNHRMQRNQQSGRL